MNKVHKKLNEIVDFVESKADVLFSITDLEREMSFVTNQPPHREISIRAYCEFIINKADSGYSSLRDFAKVAKVSLNNYNSLGIKVDDVTLLKYMDACDQLLKKQELCCE